MIKIPIKCDLSHKSLKPKLEKKANKKKRIKILKFQMHNNPICMKIVLPKWRAASLKCSLLQKSKGPEKLTVEKYWVEPRQ